jgi:hypothetical protein
MKKDLFETTDNQCSFLDECVFIRENQTKMPELVVRIQNNFCTKSACFRCARFQISQLLGLEAVPPLMLPSQIEWARQIIEEYGSELSENELSAETQ